MLSDSPEVARSSLTLDVPTRISGAVPSIRAILISRSFQISQSPLVVLCPNDDIAQDLCNDLECLSSIVDEIQLDILHFPTWEQSPYSSISPSIRTRLARLAVLSRTVALKASPIIVTSIAAASQATLPKALFEEVAIKLKLEDSVETRERLVLRLLDCGYMKVDPVEDPGTFSVRGEIIDIFPPHNIRPIRIELFGDIVEKIREFDPATQRALPENLQDIFIPPAREVLIRESTSALIRENLKKRADDLGIPRTTRDPILNRIRNGNYPDHSDAWAPFAYGEPATLWEYLPKESIVIWNDELSCQQEWESFLKKQTESSEKSSSVEIIAPEVTSLFKWEPQLESRVRDQSRLFLDFLEMGDDSFQGKRLRVSATNNNAFNRGNHHPLEKWEPQLRLWLKQGFKVISLASTQSQLERIRFLLEERGIVCEQGKQAKPSLISLRLGSLSEGFCWPAEGLVILTEGEILGAQHKKKQREKSPSSGSAAKDWSGLQALSDLGTGDTVVHKDHGIGRYQGIVRLDLSGAPSDFLQLEYANKDRLYLPVYRLNVIQKYVGAGESAVLDRLGSQQFSKTKEKVRNAVKSLAFDLVQLYAQRKIETGHAFSPRDSDFREFEGRFPFDETPDQSKAIDAVLSDLESGQVMDRLVCGDVGYGKTEVAIRAAFRVVSEGKQVAVLVPTTVLAQQHEISFKNRLKDYPLIIESVSRFKSNKTQKEILNSLSKGKVDIIVGTHRLLSRDVKFHDLGLIVVDEEHRFGVEHKERLKTLKVNTHVLTLTATPIPRTLHMALSGLRDISLINTPPVDRQPIRTYVSKYDEAMIQRAIEFELARGGQVFYLHNRVQTIHKLAEKVRELVPSSEVLVAHGQMPETELEDAMLAFYQKKANVLICTSIIESGLDIPSANTILIDRADALGLSQLYQIRGRVGRGQQRAYAYLFIPKEGAVSEDAKRRLEVIQRFVELGSGFSIASHDLEIRGGGDLLGAQQSGNIAAVGFDLYTELLEEAIQGIQNKSGQTEEVVREPEIKAPFPSYLSEEYVPDVHQRLSLYRRFSAASLETEITLLEEELRDRYGNLPPEALNLMWLIRIKLLLKKIGIEVLTVGSERVTLLPGAGSKLNPVRAIALTSAYPEKYQIKPDSKLVAKIPTATLRDLFFALENLFKDFS